MKFYQLPEAIRRRCLKYEENTLTPAVEKRAAEFSRPCPRCGGALQQHLAEKAFNTLSILPRTIARCVDCGHEIDTQSGMTVKSGNPALVEEPFPLIKPSED